MVDDLVWSKVDVHAVGIAQEDTIRRSGLAVHVEEEGVRAIEVVVDRVWRVEVPQGVGHGVQEEGTHVLA